MACAFSRYNAHSDWLALGYYSPVKATAGRLRTCKNRAKRYIINKSLTSNRFGLYGRIGTLSSGKVDCDGDAETCEKAWERTPLWWEFTNIKWQSR